MQKFWIQKPSALHTLFLAQTLSVYQRVKNEFLPWSPVIFLWLLAIFLTATE